MKHLLHILPVALLLSSTAFSQTDNQKLSAPSYVQDGLKQHAAKNMQAPVAADDIITGISRQSVSGNVLGNDRDPQGKRLAVYLVSTSPDGSLGIATNGDFTFNPDKDFAGSTTTFSYKICNGSLCSETATVTINFPSIAAPAILNDFTANCDEANNVKLNWNTDAETGNEHFNIERSTDGVNFTRVGTVAGQTTAGPHSYSFTQKVSRQTAGKNDLYYRVKMVTAEDAVTTSKVLIARVYKTKTLQLLSVTPNPTINDIKVNAQLNEDAYIVLKVMNQAGTELIRKTVKSPAGMNSYTLEGSGKLDKGM
ncbi:MAG TPA: Ig-like domain-containing protein, partial [Chitinophagaceae bacterium]|nr:Ig-like domain-containing protein [Chitinophagaceae bacterium]